ncbi:MAG: hypothetical protein ACJ8BW_20045, partial [Ktedonobacteraceae bacterium]
LSYSMIALLLVLLLGTGATLLLATIKPNGADHPTAQTPLVATTRLITPTPIAPSTIYPTLANSYGGEVADRLAQVTTPLFLRNIQQKQASFHGLFSGLGLAGPFTGSVTPSGHLQFSVSIQGGNSTLAFTGDIKVGGDWTGSYKVLDQRGQWTGESGLWNAAPNA